MTRPKKSIALLLLAIGAFVACSGSPAAPPTNDLAAASASPSSAYHLTASRQRGAVLYRMETWYADETHQRTDTQVSLPDGERPTMGTVFNGSEYWSFRVQQTTPGLTTGLHVTEGHTRPTGRLLFLHEELATLADRFRGQGCAVAQDDGGVVLGRKSVKTTITPSGGCTGQDFDMPSRAVVDNNVNFYVSPGTPGQKSGTGPMTIWTDAETALVLRAQRTTADGSAWDVYVVETLAYNPTIPKNKFAYSPLPGMDVVTNPG